MTHPNARFIEELAYHGHTFGAGLTAFEKDLLKDIVDYVKCPTAPPGARVGPAAAGAGLHGADSREACLALVAGARHAAAKARLVEVLAAQLARSLEPPVTVRQLADVAGISERAAAARYPRRTEANGTCEA